MDSVCCNIFYGFDTCRLRCKLSHTPVPELTWPACLKQRTKKLRRLSPVKPPPPLPVNLIVVRLQDRGYHSYSMKDAVSLGRYSIVMTRDIEDEADFERINKFPQLEQVGTLNRILLPAEIRTDKDLRVSAAKLHADMLLLYTVDTKFWSEDSAKPLSVVTLGFSPTVNVHMISTISGVLMDVRTGYVYGAIEATEKQTQLSSWWANADTIDQSRLRVEQIAFDKVLDEFEKLWIGVVAERKAILNMQQK